MDTKRVVTFSDLGEFGRLGNQLYQIAATIGVAHDHGLQARFDHWQRRAEFRLPDWLWGEVPPDAVDTRAYAQHITPGHLPYLQDLGLFANVLADVTRWLTPAEPIVEEARERLGDLLDRPCPTAVHVRRGDFVGQNHFHPTLPEVYYEEACARLPRRATVIVFSDDPDWCRSHLRGLRPASVFEPSRDVVDLAAMALCERHVIANSSFSYWGAMLARDPAAIHVHPDHWYGPGHAAADPSLRLPPDWIAIDPWAERTLRGRLRSVPRWVRQARTRLSHSLSSAAPSRPLRPGDRQRTYARRR